METVAARLPRATRRAGLALAFRRVSPYAFLGVLPLLYGALAAYTVLHLHNYALDFRGEYYPEAKLVLRGLNPYPSPDADLSGGVNQVFPIPAALLVAPFTILSSAAAGALFSIGLVAALAATLWLLDVRDWRVYGAVLLWPPVLAAVQTGNLTIILGFLSAIAWRYRDRMTSAVAIGLAIALKLYLWPLLIWFLAVRKPKFAAVAAAIGSLGILLVLPFTSLERYLRLLENLGRTFAPQSYSIQGLLQPMGVSRSVALLFTYFVGAGVLWIVYRRRSYPLAIAAALLLSPIVWLHYVELLVIPFALARPRFTALWLTPLAFWGCSGNGATVRPWMVVLVLLVGTATLAWAEVARPQQRTPLAGT